jgi:hypothetical protein
MLLLLCGGGGGGDVAAAVTNMQHPVFEAQHLLRVNLKD